MKSFKKILNKEAINVNNDNKYFSINDFNDDNDNNRNSTYALDRNKFTPNTEETQLADEIATYFEDTGNYAFYLSTIKKKGVANIMSLFRAVQEDIKEKEKTKYPVRDSKRYFTWKYKKGSY